VIGFAGGTIEKLPLNLVLLKNISIVGLHWGAYAKFDTTRIPFVWDSLFELFESQKVKPVVYSQSFRGLDSIAAGLKALESRETWGKAVVHVRDDETQARL